MNYTKKEVTRKHSNLKNKKKNGNGAISFLKVVTATLLIAIAVSLGLAAVYAGRLISSCPDIEDVDISPEGFLTHVLDANGNEIETLAATGANREYVELKSIPKDLQNAFVAIEDKKFYEHNGIDMAGIIRAGVSGVLSGGEFSQGASTITQQLLKNNFFSGWTSEKTFQDRVERKIQEQYLAIQLEKVVSKEEILENYLNTINLGQNTLGVEAAAKRYFNKTVSQLTLSESAVIAGITQNPTKYNPIINPDENSKRRKKVLDDMKSLSFISQSEYDAAMQDDVYTRIAILNSELESGTTSYFVDALCEQVANDLMNELNMSEAEAYNKLYSGGLTIYSTQDPELQAVCDEEVNNVDNYGGSPQYSFAYRLTIQKPDGTLKNFSEQTMLSHYQEKNRSYSINFNSEEAALEAIEAYKSEIMEPGDTIPEAGETINITLQPQVAISLIDQSTGQVPAIVGGRGDKSASRTLNRATGTTRQPGSTFKIIASYAPAIDAGGMSLATAIDNSPMTYADGTPIRNYDNSYTGMTPIREGIIHSINVMAVKALTEIGTGLGLQYCRDFGLSTMENTDNGQALALGGITYGVKNIELCGAYATIANLGKYNRPVFYTKVEDYRGEIILDTTDDEPKEVIKDTTAFVLTDAMKDVMTRGTGTPANFPGMTLAGKSGTTTSNRDTLFAGYSPYYTCVIWGGFDDNAVQKSTTYSKKIWREVMRRVHEDLPNKDFDIPEGIVRASVCSKSGKLMTEICGMDIGTEEGGGAFARSEYFAKGSEPTEPCDRHVHAVVCMESGMLAGPGCPAAEGVFTVGDDANTASNPFRITKESILQTCNLHVGGYFPPTAPSVTPNNGGVISDINNNTPTPTPAPNPPTPPDDSNVPETDPNAGGDNGGGE